MRVTFEETVLPILRSNCTPCHDQANKTSGLSVMTRESLMAGGNRRGPAVIAGSPEHSPLAQVLRGVVKPQMPPGRTMPAAELGVIEDWIRASRPESTAKESGPRWSLVRPVRPQVRSGWPAGM